MTRDIKWLPMKAELAATARNAHSSLNYALPARSTPTSVTGPSVAHYYIRGRVKSGDFTLVRLALEGLGCMAPSTEQRGSALQQWHHDI